MKLKYKIFISFIFVIIFITIYSHLIFVQRANTIKIKNKIEIVKNNYNNLNSFIEIVTMNLDLLTKQLTFIEISNAKLENKEYRYIFLSELRKKINNYLNINPKVKIDFDLVDYNTEILISTQPENIGKKICDEKTKYIDILKKRLLEQNVKKYTANYSNYIYILYPIFLNNNDNYKYLFILTINTNDFFQNLDLIENNGCLTNAKYIKHTQLSKLADYLKNNADKKYIEVLIDNFYFLVFKNDDVTLKFAIDIKKGWLNLFFDVNFLLMNFKILLPLLITITILALYFTKLIYTPINIMINSFNDINENKEYKLNIKQKDEIGQLSEKLEFYVNRTNNLLAEKEKFIDNLIKLQSRIEFDLKSKEEYLRNIVHDLKTPLHSIISYSSILKNKTINLIDDRQKKNIDRIITNAQFMITQVENILDFTKIINNYEDTLNIKKFNVQNMYKDIFHIINPLIDKRYINFICHTKFIYQNVYSDEYKIKSIFLNLLSNSLKNTLSGYIKLYIKTTRNKIFIIVKDSGKGIAKEKQKELFEPFKKEETNALQKKFSSSGVGLTIIKKNVELLKATIHFKSEINKGTEFKIIIPYKKPNGENKNGSKKKSNGN